MCSCAEIKNKAVPYYRENSFFAQVSVAVLLENFVSTSTRMDEEEQVSLLAVGLLMRAPATA